MTSQAQIIVSAQDLRRLTSLLDTAVGKAFVREAGMLRNELQRAQVVPPDSVPPHVATMNSRLIYEDLDTGDEREITLVYPWIAAPDARRISVLSPLGTALLGLSVGSSIEWTMPDGSVRRWRLLAIPFQPEAAGDTYL